MESREGKRPEKIDQKAGLLTQGEKARV